MAKQHDPRFAPARRSPSAARGTISDIDLDESRERRRAQADARRRAGRRRLLALCSLVAVIVVAIVVVLGAGGSSPGTARLAASTRSRADARARGGRGARDGRRERRGARAHRSGSTVTGRATGVPGTDHVPVLMYHVIAAPPGGAPYPGLYVPAAEFAAQMQALKAAGWHGVTLDQLRAYWTRGVPLGPGKPIVITFDNGYRSQYASALPVLERLRWPADENIQLTGLPPSQGGMTTAQVRSLIDAGWELDTQGESHFDLATATAAELQYQIVDARRTLRRRYHVPVEWFCYPSGQYDASVVAAVKAAGFVGSTTVVPGWAAPGADPYTLPRLRVLGGTSPAGLLEQIASTRSNAAPPGRYVTG